MRPRFVRKAREDEEPARSLEDTEWGRRCVGRPRFADAVRTNARVHALIFEAGAAGAVALANASIDMPHRCLTWKQNGVRAEPSLFRSGRRSGMGRERGAAVVCRCSADECVEHRR